MLLLLHSSPFGFVSGLQYRALVGCQSRLAIAPAMLVDPAALSLGETVVVSGTDDYPKFYHVPGHGKDGFIAKGMAGVVEKVYDPEACILDRSDDRNVLVQFSEPKKWKAHFMAEELMLPSDSASEDGEPMSSTAAVAEFADVEMCDVAEGSPCDRVDRFMTPLEKATILSPDLAMRDAAQMLYSNKITGAPVAVDGKLVGVLTQFDFLYREIAADTKVAQAVALDSGKWEAAVMKALGGTVRTAMSKPVAVAPASDMAQVAGLMLSRRFNHVPVIESDGSLVGILTSQDVMGHVLTRWERE